MQTIVFDSFFDYILFSIFLMIHDSLEHSLMILLKEFFFGPCGLGNNFLEGVMFEFLDEIFCIIYGTPIFWSHFSDALEFETLDTFQSGFYTARFRIEVASIL